MNGTYTSLLKMKPGDQRPVEQVKAVEEKKRVSKKQPRYHDTTTPRYHDTTVSRYHDTTIEAVRKAVKQVGKEAATHRFTKEEKKALADIIYTYKGLDVLTSENEITRIGVNFLIQDHRENGELSVLGKVLKALNE